MEMSEVEGASGLTQLSNSRSEILDLALKTKEEIKRQMSENSKELKKVTEQIETIYSSPSYNAIHVAAFFVLFYQKIVEQYPGTNAMNDFRPYFDFISTSCESFNIISCESLETLLAKQEKEIVVIEIALKHGKEFIELVYNSNDDPILKFKFKFATGDDFYFALNSSNLDDTVNLLTFMKNQVYQSSLHEFILKIFSFTNMRISDFLTVLMILCTVHRLPNSLHLDRNLNYEYLFDAKNKNAILQPFAPKEAFFLFWTSFFDMYMQFSCFLIFDPASKNVRHRWSLRLTEMANTETEQLLREFKYPGKDMMKTFCSPIQKSRD